MIDVFSDEWITFEALSRQIPGKPHKNSIHRWSSRGRNGVKLRSLIINGQRCTKREWVNEFFAATENGGDAERDEKAKTSTAKRATRARKRLAQAGI